MTAMSLPIADIGELDPSLYVGLIDAAAVECLSVRLAADGLLNPIWVRRNGNAAAMKWSVIAGRHRLRAAIRLGWTAINVEERASSVSSAEELRGLQIAENLDRRSLRPIERACHIMERWRSEATAKAWDTVSQARETDEVTAAACGNVDPRTIRRYRRIFDAIVLGLPHHFATLNAHALGESLSAMTKLASLDEAVRLKAAEAIVSNPDWLSIDQALAAAGVGLSKGTRVDRNNFGSIMMDAWERMPTKARQDHVEWLVERVTPGMAMNMVAGFKKRGLL